MNDDRRRRRANPELGIRRTKKGPPNPYVPWLITVAAAIAVVAGGWFLGQALAHAFGGRATTQTAQTQASSAPIVTPLPSPSATELSETPEPSPQPTFTQAPATEPSRAATPAPPPTVPPTPAPAPTQAPASPAPATPAPQAAATSTRTAHPATAEPAATAAAVTPAPVAAVQNSGAEHTVLAYIDALRRGDPQSAAALLGNGVPDESFIDAQTRVLNITSTSNADGSAKVDVRLQTGQGTYLESFQVAPSADGSRILDKSATKQ